SIHYSRYSLRLRWPQRGHYGRQSSRDPRSSTAVEQRLAARAHWVVRVFYKTRPNDVRCLLAARYVAQAVASDQSDVALDRNCSIALQHQTAPRPSNVPLRRAVPFSGQVPRAMSNAPLPRRTSAIENARFTCHRSQALIPHAEPSAGVRNSARHRRAGPNGMLQHSASPASPGLDHERAEDSRRATRRTARGEHASSPRRQPSSFPNNALRRRRGELTSD
ncbi:unnamed protein product, partial [Pelagomonas calceolata]